MIPSSLFHPPWRNKKKSLSCSAHFNTFKCLAYLKTLEILLPIHIKRVGFSGDDRFQMKNQIGKYISALHLDDKIHIIGFKPHGLSVRKKLSLDVMAAEYRLVDWLFQSIRSQI